MTVTPIDHLPAHIRNQHLAYAVAQQKADALAWQSVEAHRDADAQWGYLNTLIEEQLQQPNSQETDQALRTLGHIYGVKVPERPIMEACPFWQPANNEGRLVWQYQAAHSPQTRPSGRPNPLGQHKDYLKDRPPAHQQPTSKEDDHAPD